MDAIWLGDLEERLTGGDPGDIEQEIVREGDEWLVLQLNPALIAALVSMDTEAIDDFAKEWLLSENDRELLDRLVVLVRGGADQGEECGLPALASRRAGFSHRMSAPEGRLRLSDLKLRTTVQLLTTVIDFLGPAMAISPSDDTGAFPTARHLPAMVNTVVIPELAQQPWSGQEIPYSRPSSQHYANVLI